ncbi:hypothetical protein [Neolewinella litorea]|uniref:DUF2383 domain-containing protein n=1 Tax=Neolewinella litorea TaxID=2562452 RepID=A0A4S4NQZ5_9BACT|nr:hypothetical protein [Neolewinella litorea]THH41595.1 hypothetical protein E4021_03090 [Neolewinella litorea]
MKTPYEVRPEGTDATLNEIAILHRQSAGYYRGMASGIESSDETAAGYFRALADYHKEMMEEVNRILADMAGGVHTPSRTGETVLKKREQALNRAVQSKNTVELSELAHENEKGVSDAYQHALGNPNLIDFARELLQKQHEKVLIWVNRADRYKTVPQDFNEHYDPETR